MFPMEVLRNNLIILICKSVFQNRSLKFTGFQAFGLSGTPSMHIHIYVYVICLSTHHTYVSAYIILI